MSLSELMNLQVSAASKQLERIEEAPGIISVLTKNDIANYGANSLHELLRRVPGINPHTSHLIPDNLVSIRGQHSSVIDRRNLVLINGRPIREAQTGGAGATFYKAFPIAAIEHVEIIRGPGSVLHGSNALSGVINVVTRTDSQNAVELYAGSHHTYGADFYYSHAKDDWSVLLSGNALAAEGWLFQSNDINGVYDSHEMGEDRSGVVLQLAKGPFSFDLFDGRIQQDFLGSNQTWPFDYYDRSTTHIDLGYEAEVSGDWITSLNLTSNHHARETISGLVNVSSKNTVFEGNLKGPINENTNGIFGVTLTDLQSNNWVAPDPSSSRTWKTAYTQIDFNPTESLKLTFGGQYNDIETDTDTSLRAALLWRSNQNWGFKALYGEAYRSPALSELFNFIPGALQGNPNLVPEDMTNYDFQIYYHSDAFRIDLTYFDSRITNAIGFVFPGGVRTFANTGSMDFKGFELEAKYPISKHLVFDASLSHQENVNQNGISGRQLEPDTSAKLGLTYEFANGGSISLFDNFYTKPPEWREFSGAVQELNPNTGSYHHLTLNARLPASLVFPGPEWQDVEFTLFVDNALQSSPVYWPDISRSNLNAWPRYPERRFYFKTKIRF